MPPDKSIVRAVCPQHPNPSSGEEPFKTKAGDGWHLVCGVCHEPVKERAYVAVDALLSDEAIEAARVGSGVRGRLTAMNTRAAIEAAIRVAQTGGDHA